MHVTKNRLALLQLACSQVRARQAEDSRQELNQMVANSEKAVKQVSGLLQTAPLRPWWEVASNHK